MRGMLLAGLVVLSLALGGAGTASAAQQVGNPCVADDTEADMTIVGGSWSENGSTLHMGIPPEHRFVITHWRVASGPGVGPIAQQLVAAHLSGESSLRKVGESAVETVVPGVNEFATRIPVSEYDSIGLSGPNGTLVCHQAGAVSERFPGPWAIGEERQAEFLGDIGTPLMVTVERDEDGDGYGDETQDHCPISILDQGPCPIFGIRTPQRRITRRAIWLELGATMPAAAKVTGTISWPRGGNRRGQTVVKLTTPPVALSPEAIVTVRVALPRSVLRHLATVPEGRGIQAELKISAVNERGETAGGTRRFKIHGHQRG